MNTFKTKITSNFFLAIMLSSATIMCPIKKINAGTVAELQEINKNIITVNTINQQKLNKAIQLFSNNTSKTAVPQNYIKILNTLYTWVFNGNNTNENLELVLVKEAYDVYINNAHIQKKPRIEQQYNQICNEIQAQERAKQEAREAQEKTNQEARETQEKILNKGNDDNDGEVIAGMSKSPLQKLEEVDNFLNGNDDENEPISRIANLIENIPSTYNNYIVGTFRKKTKKLSDDLTSLINNFNKAYNLFKEKLTDQKNINDSTLKQKELEIINKLHKAVYNIHTLLIVPFEITITENHPTEENLDKLYSFFFEEEKKLKELNGNIKNATQACKDFVNHIITLANKHQIRHDISYTPNNKTYDVPEDYQDKFFAICNKMHKAKAGSWLVRHKKLLIGGTIVTIVLVGSGAAIYYVIIPQWGLIYSSIASGWNYITGAKAAAEVAEVAEVTTSIWDSSIAQFLRRIARPDKYIMRFFKRN